MEEMLEMSKKELDRYTILQKILNKELKQKIAADLLGISDRQLRNLLTRFTQEGVKGLISRKRGKPGNHQKPKEVKQSILALIKERYPDFGPTFAREKLIQYHNLTVSDETLRQWMIQENLWKPRKSRRCLHPLRPRREYFGELIQVDASHHHWFEDRGEKCALVVFIDDATSRITSLFFCKSECLEGYFTALKNHLIKHGRPRGIYSDRHAIFGGSDKIHHAQFIRALKELDIESLLARSPQAKGRVERANQTLQDRLVKEMRLQNISTIEDANHYLEEFIEEFNHRFSKEPRGQFDAHRPLDSGYNLERILARREVRTLSKDLSFSFHSKIYKIVEPQMINRLKGKKVEVSRGMDDVLRAYYMDKEVKCLLAEEDMSDQRILNGKEKLEWKSKGIYRPPEHHPWKSCEYQAGLKTKQQQWKAVI